MRNVRVGRRTAIVGVTMHDLGILMDALYGQLGWSKPPTLPPSEEMADEFRRDTERLTRQVTAALFAMGEWGGGTA